MPTNPGAPSLTWAAYQSRVVTLQALHADLPVGFNIAPQWWTMQVDRALMNFTTYDIATPPPGPTVAGVVAYSSAVNIDVDPDLEILQVDWRPNVASGGAFVILDFAGGVFQSARRFQIEGASNVWTLRNFNTGQELIVLTGLDEGKLGTTTLNHAVAPTLIYNPVTNTLINTGILTTSHESTVVDFDHDGDEDIVAQSWQEPFNGNITFLRNDGDTLTAVAVPGSNFSSGMSLEVLDLDNDGTWELLIGDVNPNSFGETNPGERNQARHFNANGTTSFLYELPIPYFERPIYNNLPTRPNWDGNVGRSHDISIVAADIDNDGDEDAVMASYIWDDNNTFAVHQLLINHNGVLVDETDTRFYNTLLTKYGSHNFHLRDVNNDGFVDIVAQGHGPAYWRNTAVDNSLTDANEILVNDGTGRFISAISYQTGANLHSPQAFSEYEGRARWTRINEIPATGAWVISVVESTFAFSTGPGLRDPAAQNVPGFNEFYYLLNNADAQASVASGQYASGLAHYLAVGAGRNIYAPGARVNGDADSETITAREGAETLHGNGGNDVLAGRAGADRVYGGDGDDIIELRSGEVAAGEIADGGAGNDTLRVMGANVDLRGAAFAALERIQFTRIGAEATLNAQITASQIAGLGAALILTGSAAQDSIQVFAAANGSVSTAGWLFDFPAWGLEDYIVYVGETGNESFIGFQGLDIYFGSPGNDTYDGRGAVDFAAYLFSPNAVTADLAIATAQAIGGNQGSDTFINLEGLAGSQFADILFGDAGGNFLLGLHGNDTLIGRAGADDIRGGEHADRIEGGMGADTLWGAMDPAVMSGPDGADTFVYRNAAEGGDTIRDFQAGVDKIEVSAAGFGGGLVAGGAVVVRATQNQVTGAGGQFVYNSFDGDLFWDADGAGAGAAVRIANLANFANLTAADIVVTAIAAAGIDDAVLEEMADSLPAPEVSLGPDSLFPF